MSQGDAMGELHAVLQRLALVSCAPIQGYEFAPPEHRRPYSWRLSDAKPAPAHTSSHRPKDGDSSIPRGGIDRQGDRTPEFRQKSAEHFAHRAARARTDQQLLALLGEAKEALEAWQKTPLIAGMRPAMADPRWKQWVADCDHSVAELVKWYGCSRQHIYNVRRAYREAA